VNKFVEQNNANITQAASRAPARGAVVKIGAFLQAKGGYLLGQIARHEQGREDVLCLMVFDVLN
jgi:hypothetical protein